MTKCNRKKQLLGKSIRNVRMRRNMTQRELANAIEGIGESALRSYELGERSPKQDALERIAKEEQAEEVEADGLHRARGRVHGVPAS